MFKNQILSKPAELGRLLRGKGGRLLTSIESSSYLIISHSLNRQRERQKRKTRRLERGILRDDEMRRVRDRETISGEKEDRETEIPP